MRPLSRLEQRAWTLHESGLGSAEIAAELGRSMASVSDALIRARRKLGAPRLREEPKPAPEPEPTGRPWSPLTDPKPEWLRRQVGRGK